MQQNKTQHQHHHETKNTNKIDRQKNPIIYMSRFFHVPLFSHPVIFPKTVGKSQWDTYVPAEVKYVPAENGNNTKKTITLNYMLGIKWGLLF